MYTAKHHNKYLYKGYHQTLCKMLHWCIKNCGLFPNLLRFLHRIWLFPHKIFNVGSILLCMITIICCKSMNYHSAITNTDTTHFFLFLAFYAQKLITLLQIRLFCPKLAKFRPIQLEIIDYIVGKFMNHHCANFYTIRSSNINTTNIFQFLRFCVQNLIILPTICKFYTISIGQHW